MDESCEITITKTGKYKRSYSSINSFMITKQITTGWGLCNYFLIGLCGLCTLVEAAAVSIIFIAIPLVTCDLFFNKRQIITLNAVGSLGRAFFVRLAIDKN